MEQCKHVHEQFIILNIGLIERDMKIYGWKFISKTSSLYFGIKDALVIHQLKV